MHIYIYIIICVYVKICAGHVGHFWERGVELSFSSVCQFELLDVYLVCGVRNAQGTIGCTPNVRVPMVVIVFNLGILGDYNP